MERFPYTLSIASLKECENHSVLRATIICFAKLILFVSSMTRKQHTTLVFHFYMGRNIPKHATDLKDNESVINCIRL